MPLIQINNNTGQTISVRIICPNNPDVYPGNEGTMFVGSTDQEYLPDDGNPKTVLVMDTNGNALASQSFQVNNPETCLIFRDTHTGLIRITMAYHPG